MGIHFHRGPTFGEHGWAFLSWGLLITGIFYQVLQRYANACRPISLSIEAPLGNLEGVRLWGLLREKKYYIWVSFLDPQVIKLLSLGATAPRIRYGAQRARLLRPRCIGLRGPNPIANLSYIVLLVYDNLVFAIIQPDDGQISNGRNMQFIRYV